MSKIIIFLIVFYLIFRGLKFITKIFIRGKFSKSFGNKSRKSQNDNNIEDAEFTEIESEIHTQNDNKVDGEG